MSSIDELKNAFYTLPISEKMRVFDELEWNLRKDLHEHALREDLVVVRKRFADLDAGLTQTFSSEDVMRELFHNK